MFKYIRDYASTYQIYIALSNSVGFQPIRSFVLCLFHNLEHCEGAELCRVRMANTKDFNNDDVMETEFNEVLLEYLEMEGRSSRDEDASDEEDSSSGNDSDIGRAISLDIVGDEGVKLPLPTPPRLRLPVGPYHWLCRRQEGRWMQVHERRLHR